jgi:PEP-CTERM motif
MTTKIWQKMAKVGMVALGLATVAGIAEAGGSNCGGYKQPPCPTWTFNASGTDLTHNKYFLLSETNTQAGITGTATAWSNTGDNNTNTKIQQAYIGAYGHMGVTDAQAGKSASLGSNGSATNADASSSNNELNSPDHAIDNHGNVDSVLFTFSDKVNLTSFTTGWEYSDADFSVLAYTGTGCIGGCSTDIAGLTYSDLLSKGWMLIGNYNVNGATSNGTTHSFANYNNGSTGENVTLSSYWLIGALNQWVGGDPGKVGNDYFKILSVTGCDCSTNPNLPGCGDHPMPEPGTLLLMGAGLVGLTRINRRRQGASA